MLVARFVVLTPWPRLPRERGNARPRSARAARRPVLAQHRAVPRGWRIRGVGRDWADGHVLRGLPGRGSLEDDERGRDVVSGLRFREGSVVGDRERVVE